jgi:hypothetical protein
MAAARLATLQINAKKQSVRLRQRQKSQKSQKQRRKKKPRKPLESPGATGLQSLG